MRIILVDDDEGMISVWKKWLDPLSSELLIASSVEAAIEHMRTMPPPDVVLLDLILPPNGAEHTVAAITKLRAFNPHLAVIVISGMEQDQLVRTIANSNVNAFLRKDEMLTQSSLLRATLAALQSASSSGALLERVSEIVSRLTEVEERKRSGPIKLA